MTRSGGPRATSVARGAIGLLSVGIAACGGLPQSPDAAGFAWREAAPCPIARFEAMGAVVDGRLIVLGGFIDRTGQKVTARVDVYDPARDAWTAMADMPAAQTHAGVTVADSTVYVAGGLVGFPAPPTAAVWRYVPATDRWAGVTALPEGRAALALVAVGRRVHAMAGMGPDARTDRAEHWTLDLDAPTAWGAAPPVPDARNHLAGAAVDGRVYAVGGRQGWDEFLGHRATLEVFDPATGAWAPKARLPAGRSEIGAAAFESGTHLVVIGGSTAFVTPTDEVLVYDPARDGWERLPPLPAPRKGVVAGRIGASMVVTTGSPTSTEPVATTWVGCCLP